MTQTQKTTPGPKESKGKSVFVNILTLKPPAEPFSWYLQPSEFNVAFNILQ
jgi:hypothetical protein